MHKNTALYTYLNSFSTLGVETCADTRQLLGLVEVIGAACTSPSSFASHVATTPRLSMLGVRETMEVRWAVDASEAVELLL